jgi:hypothetical protein
MSYPDLPHAHETGVEKNMTDLVTMTVLGLVIGLVILVAIVLMAIVGGSHVFD